MEWTWVIQTVIMLGIGAIGFFLKTTLSEVKQHIASSAKRVDELEDKMDTKVAGLEREVKELKSDLPFIYVTREDYIRTMNNVDKKLDRIHDTMLERGK
ncbi:hypothetical protein M5X00_24425 [Paenibacillus alvei]|uniref:Uncharacterized protein n=1 Tax=Paenibacillus alvei TaxID=44250 RepID=A0ABT4H8L0_PAEAL|nr:MULTISPECIES: hypothetical protein [Paenibacillus]EJW16242.1 hypothetical protein PAV_6c03230 [Paenibacillus alvei DSM 29]MCY9544454.1 hypothetical protein [Paenibacillus alvei]MCY9704426.1 hypothetical protein [Paenibacillus alvei]MCY9736163.1 hypothetical protein [Paenibacillus alvei]MCY9757377.1 hypothetical protein [Paenibacillus alvei]